jgi:hypothetical protein
MSIGTASSAPRSRTSPRLLTCRWATSTTRLSEWSREQGETITRYGCPYGTLSSELTKRGDASSRALAAQLMETLVDWVEEQAAALRRSDAREWAIELVVARAGWEWAAVEGTADIIGPDEPHAEVDSESLRLVLRDIFRAAGGTHDDWDADDKVMAEERRAAVFITPRRPYGNTRSG